MVEALGALFISLTLLLINYYISKDVFYPATLFCLIWSIVVFSYIFYIGNHTTQKYLFEMETLIYFVAGQILFSIGSFFTMANENKYIREEGKDDLILFDIDKWIIFFLLAILPVYINKLMSIVNSSKLNKLNFYVVLRYEFVSNGVTVGILDYLNPICVFAFSLSLYRFNIIKNGGIKTVRDTLYKILCYMLAFTYAFLTTGRTYFVMMFSVYIGYKVISKSFKRRHLIGAIVAFIIIFIGNAFILGKGADSDATVAENTSSIFENITTYFLGGPYGFNGLIKTDYPLEYGENVFRFFISVAYALKLLALPPKDLVMPYVTTPILTNVYTVYYNYIKDFSYFGLFFMSIWGYIHTFFYFKSRQSFFYLYCYTLLLYPLIMSFFQDQYLSLLSTWIQLLFYGFIASKFIVNKKQTIIN